MNRRLLLPILILMVGTSSAFARGLSEGATPTSIQGTDIYLTNEARHSESKGDWASAILFYNELLLRHPSDTHYADRLTHCEMAMENAGQGAAADKQLIVRSKSSDDSDPPLPDDSGTPQLSAQRLPAETKTSN